MKKIREKWHQLSAIDRAVAIFTALFFLTVIAAGFIWRDQTWAVLLELGCTLGLVALMLIKTFRSKDLTAPNKWVFFFRAFACLCFISADLLPRIGWGILSEEIILPLKCIGLLALVGSFYLDELFSEGKTDLEEMK